MLYSIFLILGVICGVLNVYEGFMLHNRLHETNEPTEDEIKQMRNYIFWGAIAWIVIVLQMFLSVITF